MDLWEIKNLFIYLYGLIKWHLFLPSRVGVRVCVCIRAQIVLSDK